MGWSLAAGAAEALNIKEGDANFRLPFKLSERSVAAINVKTIR